jgi:hypothetical protein
MNLFEKIDNYFYERDKKEFLYTIVLIIGVIGFLIYYFVYPAIEEYKSKEEKSYQESLSKFQKLKTSIRVLEARVSVLNKKIKEKQNQLTILKKQKMFYTELANLLDFAEFDQYKWANFVRETVKDAKNKGLEVVKVENKIYDVNIDLKKGKKKSKNSSFIVKRMDIAIQLEGKYKNFIYYLYNYENRKELARVEEMKILSPSNYYVKFSIYGYNK